MYTRALELNQESTFPVWFSGTSAANFFGIGNLQDIDLPNVKETLEFNEDFTNKAIKNLPILFPESKTYFNLDKAFTPKGISLHPIATKWIIDATAEDSRGNTFVALFHHHVYPVYASFA